MDLFIVGAGGLGRETYDAVLACGQAARAFVDEREAGGTCRGLEVVAPADLPANGRFVVGVADPGARRRLATLLEDRGLVAATVVHPRAVVGPETAVGRGSVVLANAHISSSVRIGAHVHVNYNATIGHDAVLDDFVTVLPGANVAGGVHLEQDVTVGTNACVLQRLRVGEGGVVGAGAVVTRSSAPGEVLIGVPARPRQNPADHRRRGGD